MVLFGGGEVVAFHPGGRSKLVSTGVSKARGMTMTVEPTIVLLAKARKVLTVNKPSFSSQLLQSLKGTPLPIKVFTVVVLVVVLATQLFPNLLNLLIEKFTKKAAPASTWSPAKVVLPPATPPSTPTSLMDKETATKVAEQIIQEDAERQARVLLAKSKEASAVAAAEEARQERVKLEKDIKAQQGTTNITISIS